MPQSMAKLLDQLAVPADARDVAALDAALKPGAALPPPQGIFPRYLEEGAVAAKGRG
jgi:methionyl-tRNA synthetase